MAVRLDEPGRVRKLIRVGITEDLTAVAQDASGEPVEVLLRMETGLTRKSHGGHFKPRCAADIIGVKPQTFREGGLLAKHGILVAPARRIEIPVNPAEFAID